MRTLDELKDLVKRVEWNNRYVSTAGVVPATLAWELIDEIAILFEMIHKGQGMANEINILTAENKRLREELSATQRELDRARKR